jgi:hypothetical protein
MILFIPRSMGELYLSSRTEVLRSMDIDTGRKIAIVGAPEDFIVWMNKILPLHTRVVGTPQDIGSDMEFDIILWWAPDGVESENYEKLAGSLSSSGDLWVIVRKGIKIPGRSEHHMPERTLMITPTMDLVPLIVRSSPE